jgi:hypothetical protein
MIPIMKMLLADVLKCPIEQVPQQLFEGPSAARFAEACRAVAHHVLDRQPDPKLAAEIFATAAVTDPAFCKALAEFLSEAGFDVPRSG